MRDVGLIDVCTWLPWGPKIAKKSLHAALEKLCSTLHWMIARWFFVPQRVIFRFSVCFPVRTHANSTCRSVALSVACACRQPPGLPSWISLCTWRLSWDCSRCEGLYGDVCSFSFFWRIYMNNFIFTCFKGVAGISFLPLGLWWFIMMPRCSWIWEVALISFDPSAIDR